MRLVFIASLVAAVLVVVPAAAALDIVAEPNVLADGEVGVPYAHDFEGEEGCPPSYHFALDSGYLPPGLAIERDTGNLKGIPTTPGDYHFFVELTDDCGHTPSQADFHIRILPPLTITSSLVGTLAGRPVNTQLVATGGGTVTWSISAGALPPGLSLSEKGLLSGATSALGTYTFTVKVHDPVRVETKQFTYVVASPLAATPPAGSPAEVGVRFSASPSASGGIPPLRWSVAGGSLPPGLSLDSATGALSGTPSRAGSFPLTLSVTDALGNVASVNTQVAVAARLTIASSRLTARLGKAYRVRLAKRGGVGSVTWRIASGRLPAGLRLNARTGVVSGRPVVAGKRSVTLTARDALGAVARRTVVFTVR